MENQPTETDNSVLPAGGIATAISGNDTTHIIFILDRSGSMSGKEQDVIGGFNSYVDGLRSNPDGEVGISCVLFDNHLQLVWNDKPLAELPRLTPDIFRVRGSTALLDAVGSTISAVRENPAHRYTVITHTDGMENASREWTADKVKALIERLEATGNWTFVFFGEGLDAWSQAGRYGYSRGSSMSYAPEDLQNVYRSSSRVSNLMRSRRMPSSRGFGSATGAVMENPEMSDDDVAAILSEDEGSLDGNVDAGPAQ